MRRPRGTHLIRQRTQRPRRIPAWRDRPPAQSLPRWWTRTASPVENDEAQDGAFERVAIVHTPLHRGGRSRPIERRAPLDMQGGDWARPIPSDTDHTPYRSRGRDVGADCGAPSTIPAASGARACSSTINCRQCESMVVDRGEWGEPWRDVRETAISHAIGHANGQRARCTRRKHPMSGAYRQPSSASIARKTDFALVGDGACIPGQHAPGYPVSCRPRVTTRRHRFATTGVPSRHFGAGFWRCHLHRRRIVQSFRESGQRLLLRVSQAASLRAVRDAVDRRAVFLRSRANERPDLPRH